MLAHCYYYAKAYVAALSMGVIYLTTVIGPDITFADLGHVSLLHWIGFVSAVLGVGGLTAVVTNGGKPAPAPSTEPAADPIASVLAYSPAPATSFASTQALLDASVPATAEPVDAPVTPAQ